MKKTRLKKGYCKKNGTVVSAHSQNYTYRDFAKMRLKKILETQKQKNVMLAMKQMGKEWAKAKTMRSEDIKKNYGQVGYDFRRIMENQRSIRDIAEKATKDYLRDATPYNETKVIDAYALAKNFELKHGYSAPISDTKREIAKTLDVTTSELDAMASPRYKFGSLRRGSGLSISELNRKFLDKGTTIKTRSGKWVGQNLRR